MLSAFGFVNSLLGMTPRINLQVLEDRFTNDMVHSNTYRCIWVILQNYTDTTLLSCFQSTDRTKKK